jgi:G:T-mismatch repair DNA endonuclease (very short patch repair protein)
VIKQYPDASLEKYLKDVHCSVDIYIPSIKKIIECHGDYWHCNPLLYNPDYYNKSLHMTAKEVWERDDKKIKKLKDAGYDVQVVWENSSKLVKQLIKN